MQRGDTIGSLLARASVVDPDAMEFLRTDPSARALYQLRPGRAVRVATDDDGRLAGLRFLASNGELLSIGALRRRVSARSVEAPPEDTRLTLRAGEIASSLFAAADAAGLPDAITLALADVFGGDIDFYHDLRRGDRFIVLYETRYVDGEPAGTGRIVAAEFVNRGIASARIPVARARRQPRATTTRTARSLAQGIPALADGVLAHHVGLHAGALSSDPAHDGARTRASISRRRSARRCARRRTAWSTFAGQQNGYGNVIMLKHGGTYSTVYAHLSRFAEGVRDGARVHQGDMIGYVGQTGWATGPHLHYEFRVDGEPRDPLTVALPIATPVSDEERAAFAAQIAPLAAELAVVRALPDVRVVARGLAAAAADRVTGEHPAPIDGSRVLRRRDVRHQPRRRRRRRRRFRAGSGKPCHTLGAAHIGFPHDAARRAARAAATGRRTSSRAQRRRRTCSPSSMPRRSRAR